MGLLLLSGVLLTFMAIKTITCWLLYSAIMQLPADYRYARPARVWVLLLPLVGSFWNLLIIGPLAESYRDYFLAQGRIEVDDCGGKVGRIYCFLSIANIFMLPFLIALPLIGLIPIVVSLLFLTKYLLTITRLKNQVAAVFPGGFPVQFATPMPTGTPIPSEASEAQGPAK